MGEFKHPENIPFRKIEKADIPTSTPHFFTLPDNPEKLVRMENFGVDYDNFPDLHRQTWLLNDTKKHFYELRKYGVHVPNIDVVVGKGPYAGPYGNRDVAYMVIDKIHGEDLWEIHKKNLEGTKTLPVSAVAEIDNCFAGLFQHIIDAYSARRPYFGDFSLGQFVYGNKKGEDKDHLYLVDVASGIERPEGYSDYTNVSSPDYDSHLQTDIFKYHNWEKQIERCEMMFDPSVRLEKSRVALEKIKKLSFPSASK